MSNELISYLEIIADRSLELIIHPDVVENVKFDKNIFYIETRKTYMSVYASTAFNGEYISGIVQHHIESHERLISIMIKNTETIYRLNEVLVWNGQVFNIADLKDDDYFFNLSLMYDDLVIGCIKLLCTQRFETMCYSYIKPMLFKEAWNRRND